MHMQGRTVLNKTNIFHKILQNVNVNIYNFLNKYLSVVPQNCQFHLSLYKFSFYFYSSKISGWIFPFYFRKLQLVSDIDDCSKETMSGSTDCLYTETEVLIVLVSEGRLRNAVSVWLPISLCAVASRELHTCRLPEIKSLYFDVLQIFWM